MIAAAPTELLVDEYELTMADSYVAEGKDSEPVAFELFARELPPNRGYLVAAGLERAVEVLTGLRFGDRALEYLERARICSPALLARLATVEFTGDLAAVPEGTVVHAREPILRVEGDLLTCQLVETLLLNQVNFQTLIATKASRIVAAADGRPVVDFGFRRAHGADAGLLAARAAYIGGCAATATVAAGYLYGVPTTGTMAHSYILSFPTDVEAFVAFLRHHPERSTLLIDTRDTVAGAHAAVEASRADRHRAPGRADRLRRPRLPDRRGARHPRRGRPRVDRDRVLGRPRRVPDRGPAGGRRPDRRVRGRDGSHHLERCPGAGRGLQARRVARPRCDEGKGPEVEPARPPPGVPRRGRRRHRRSPARICPDARCSSPSSRAAFGSAPEPPIDEARDRAAEQVGALPASVRALRDPDTLPPRLSARLHALEEDLR